LEARELAPLLDLLDDWVVVLEDGSLAYVNKKALSTLHRELADVVDRDPLSVFPPRMWANLAGLLSRLGPSSGSIVEGRLDIDHPVMGMVRANARVQRMGKLTILSLGHIPSEPEDVSVKRQADLEDRISALLGFIVGSGIGVAFVERDDGGGLVVRSVNEHLLTMLGRGEGEMLGHDPCEFVHPEEREIARRHLAQMWEEGVKSHPLTVRIPDASGEDLRVQITTVLLSPPSGNMAVCFLQDMTTMYLALEQQRKMAQAIEKIEETVVLSDGQGRIFYANPAALQSSGYTFEEVVGKPISMFAAPESAFTMGGYVFAEFMSKGSWRGDIMACTKTGRRYPVEVIGSLVRNDDGKPGMIVVVSRKIEERQRYEAELLLARRHMEYVKEVLEHDLKVVLDRSIALLDRCTEGGLQPVELRKERAALDSELAVTLAEARRVASIAPDLKNARTLKPMPLARILKERTPALAERIGAERLEVDFRSEDDDITIMANDLLPELLSRLLLVIMKLSPPGKVRAEIVLRRVHGSRGASTSGEAPDFAELSTHVPGLQLTDEVRGILSKRDMPFRAGGEGDELSLATATTSLLVFIYGGQSFIEDVVPDRPELGVRFKVLLPLADQPPRPPSAPVPVEELGARKGMRGRGKGNDRHEGGPAGAARRTRVKGT